MTPENDPKSVAVGFMETWHHEPLRRGLPHVDPDGPVWISHAAGATGMQPNNGTEFTLRRWLELLDPIVARMPDGLEVIRHRTIAEGEWVAVDTESRGALTDAIYNMRYTFWFRVRDGRVQEMKQFFDTKYGEQFFLNSHFETPVSGA